jgi:hypothetical protein
MPHWQALLRCLIKLPVVSTREQAFQIFWADKTWDDRVRYFLAGHDPSSIVDIEKFITMEMPYFDTHFLNNGIISNSAKKTLLSSIDSPKCFSNVTVCSSVIVDSGVSVCTTLHKSDFIS